MTAVKTTKEGDKKMKKREGRFMVVAVRHFINDEHHWLAPEAEDASAFGENGSVTKNAYDKPVFGSMADAERWAMSLSHGEWALSQWEEKRPTFYVVDEEVFLEVVEKDSYAYPPEAEGWSDAKTADYERECDCEDFVNCAFWDSDSDCERNDEAAIVLAREIDGVDGMDAWVTCDDEIAVSSKDGSKAAREFVESNYGDELDFNKQSPDSILFYVKSGKGE